MGSYKISPSLLKRILKKTITINENNEEITYKGISEYELRCLLYFTQICNSSGVIESIHWSEVEMDAKIPERTYQNVLVGLSKKGFIEVERNWSGYNKIKIKDNDYSNFENMEDKRYLSTLYSFLNVSNKEYSNFKKLSLYAKKTLLYILFARHENWGLRSKYETIANELGIKNRGLINKYIKEINKYIFNSYLTTSDYLEEEKAGSYSPEQTEEQKLKIRTFFKREPLERKKNGYLKILPEAFRINTIKHSKIEKNQNTYFRHIFTNFLYDENILKKENYLFVKNKINNVSNSLFAKIYTLGPIYGENNIFTIIKEIVSSCRDFLFTDPRLVLGLVDKTISYTYS